MPGPYFSDAATFLISTLFGIYILAVMLRFLLAWVRADFYNPLSQFLVKVTSPTLRPLRRWIPGVGGIDLAAVALMLGLKLIELWLVYRVAGYSPGLGGLSVLAVANLLSLAFYVFLIAILIQVVLSWVAPGTYNPAVSLIYSLTEPILRPIRRLLPPMGGLDLSPLVALIALQLVSMLLIAPIRDIGRSLL